ncbi:MAG: KamA family radical SAM protein [Oligosphaeraceae bacterium]|nr:KamA family radical SAM protein [Oligosphaeraceae bacterium]
MHNTIILPSSATADLTEQQSDEPPLLLSQNRFAASIRLSGLKTSAARSAFNVISDASRAYKQQHFPGVSDAQWNDWHWQIKNRIQSGAQFQQHCQISADEAQALQLGRNGFPFAITPYYLSLISPDDPLDPLRLAVVPSTLEYELAEDEKLDPLDEEGSSPVPGLVHRYPNRVLLLATDFCSVCCRYCTRSRLIGRVHRENCRHNWSAAIEYIEQHPEIEDVLISGGDPLTLPLAPLENLLSRLRRIEHLKIIRIGSKVPAVLPQRITPTLVNMLRKYHPLFISLHFTHPRELTPETGEACRLLANAGIPLGSQTVLLKGINDNVETMRKLMMGLLAFRVRPYYLYQCDPIRGSKHFRTPIQTGLDIIHGLRGFISGYAIPHYIIDAPGGGGKIPLIPDYTRGYEGQDLMLENYAGKTYRYPDCGRSQC